MLKRVCSMPVDFMAVKCLTNRPCCIEHSVFSAVTQLEATLIPLWACQSISLPLKRWPSLSKKVFKMIIFIHCNEHGLMYLQNVHASNI